MGHQHKAVTLQAVNKALEAHGYLLEVREAVGPETRVALEEPLAQRFHEGRVLDETLAVVARLHGRKAVTQVMYAASENTLRGVVAPLAKVLMSFAGGGPTPLLARFDALIAAGARGFVSRWEAVSATHGRLMISTVDVLPPEADYAWKGTVQYLLAFCEVEGVVTINSRQNGGRELCLDVTWSPQPNSSARDGKPATAPSRVTTADPTTQPKRA
ncbi:MAG: hypothetical protein U0228_25095 [Myxococcaceae bacterium]